MPVEHCSREKIIDVREQRRLAAPLEFRENSKDDQVILEGYAATYEPYDCYGGVERGGWVEQIDKRAFNVTLAQSPDVQLLLNHEGLPLARTTSRTLQLSADKRGLKVRAILDASDPDVQRILPKMRRGDLNEMSFAFRVKDQQWNNDYTHRLITEVSLQRGDVSVVSYGMNPDTKATVEMLARMSSDDLVELRELNKDDIKKAIEVLAKATDASYSVPTAAGDERSAPSAPSGNPKPNMQDSMIVADAVKETDPSDHSGAEIEAGIHYEPAVEKSGSADSPVKAVISPGTSLLPTLVAALQSTISHAHSVAASNNDSSRALIADAVDQIEEIAAHYANAPRQESDVERMLRELRGDSDELNSVIAMREFGNSGPDDEDEDEDGDKERSDDEQPDDEAERSDNPEEGDDEAEEASEEEDDDCEERSFSIDEALKEIRREKGVPEIHSVSEGLEYLSSIRS